MPNAVTAWSYSRWALYNSCPFAFKCKHIDKVKEEQSPAMARGDKIHKAAAHYIITPAAPAPEAVSKFGRLFDELRSLPSDQILVEQQWGFTSSWKPTGWFGKTTWMRVILDVGVVYPDGTADVVDHKTGKKYETNRDQMRLNSLALICCFPQVSHVTNRLWYLDSGDEVVDEFSADERSDEIAMWEKRVQPMFEDTVFAPRPSDKCYRCSFSKSNNGPCKFG